MFGSLLLQIAVILVMARLCGKAMRALGQPQVIGEMLAGILLGPTLLGRIDGGNVMHALFTAETRGHLDMLSQLGVVLFMFLVGLELDLAAIIEKGAQLLRIAAASMILPFGLGLLLAWCLLRAGYGPAGGGSQSGFVLFIATGLAITAFPVLARILNGSPLRGTRIASTALACAALNDAAGWCLLATVLALDHGASAPSAGGVAWHTLLTLGGVLLFVAFMVLVIRPLMRRVLSRSDAHGRFPVDSLALVFILLILSAWTTDRIGIHALFGAFMCGAILPSDPRFVSQLSQKVEDLVTLLLLPLYFATTGLHTELGLLNTPQAWAMAALVTALATLGKVGGTFLAARGPLPARQALTLGVLMNTRGLMELVVLNLAREVHAIDAQVFSMMVVMTVITTMGTSPVIAWIHAWEKRRAAAPAEITHSP